MSKTKVIAVVGPTASGKSALAVEICRRFGGEVISADSMQIYKHMSIATAKPDEAEMNGIRHHLIDFLEPDEACSVGRFVADAKAAIARIIGGGRLPVICGGTGLYIDSLLNGIEFTDESADMSVRKELKELYEQEGLDYLLNILSGIDPESAEKLSAERNPKRIMRAIELYRTTGVTLSEQNRNSRLKESEYDALIFGLTASDRQYLYDRINRRVDIMLENGLVAEAEQVLSMNLSATSSAAIGYRQLIPYFKGEDSLGSCVERLKTETRHYAKRQLTWFRRNSDINWINIDEATTAEEQLGLIEDKIRGFING